MNRILAASILVIGALFLVVGSGGTNANAFESNYCGVEGFDVPDYGSFFDFTIPCAVHDKCWGYAEDHFDLLACDNQFLREMLESCSQQGVQQRTLVMQRSSWLAYQKCIQLAYTYYTGVRVGSVFHIFSPPESNPCTVNVQTGC